MLFGLEKYLKTIPHEMNKAVSNIITLFNCMNINTLRRTETGTTTENALSARLALMDKFGGKITALVRCGQPSVRHPDIESGICDVERVVHAQLVEDRIVMLVECSNGFREPYEIIPTHIEQHAVDLPSTIQAICVQI